MPKYYCDYCDTHLIPDTPSIRKTHCKGRKHIANVKFYYQKWMEDQTQQMINATTAAFKAAKSAETGNGVPDSPRAQLQMGQTPSDPQAQPVMIIPTGMAPSRFMPPMINSAHRPIPFMIGMRPPVTGPMMLMNPMGPMRLNQPPIMNPTPVKK